MNRAQCIKNGPWPPFSWAILLVATGVCAAAVPRSSRARDPWLQLAWTLDSLPGPAALFEGGLPAPRVSCWTGRRSPFGLAGLSSTALAASWPTGLSVWQGGLHQLGFDDYRESQAVLEWQAPARGSARGALGLEWRQVADAGRREHALWARGAAAWSQGPLRLGLHLQEALFDRSAGPAGGVRGLALGWRMGLGWGLVWAWEQEGVQRREQGGLLWQGRDRGLAAAWRPGRGWELAGRLRWKGLGLSASWWSHPVLPPTPAWGLDWRAEP